MKKLRAIIMLLMIITAAICIAGCKEKEDEIKKLRDLDFTVVPDEDIPGVLKEIIEEKKEQPFKISYANKDSLYIVVGYGKQNSGGYSVSVDKLYLTQNAIYIDTNLIGPSSEDMVSEGVTYPYVVVKLEYMDERVVFE